MLLKKKRDSGFNSQGFKLSKYRKMAGLVIKPYLLWLPKVSLNNISCTYQIIKKIPKYFRNGNCPAIIVILNFDYTVPVHSSIDPYLYFISLSGKMLQQSQIYKSRGLNFRFRCKNLQAKEMTKKDQYNTESLKSCILNLTSKEKWQGSFHSALYFITHLPKLIQYKGDISYITYLLNTTD